jgi:hypothetical protein
VSRLPLLAVDVLLLVLRRRPDLLLLVEQCRCRWVRKPGK